MHASDLFRPFLLLALGAFLVGFVGYLAMAPSHAQAWSSYVTATPASAPEPVASDWNFGKEI